MIKFLQLELTANPDSPIISNGGGIPFNLNQYPGSGGSSLIHSTTNNPDTIYINAHGTYFATWFVSTQTGLSSAGSSWELTITTTDSSNYPSLAGSSHVKIAPASGSAVISLNENQAPALLKLRNTAGSDIALSSRNTCLSSLAIFEIDVEQPPAPAFTPAYLHGQIDIREDPTDFVVESEARIPFNLIKKNRNISLNTTADIGLITFAVRGIYAISWEIPIDTTEDTHDAAIALFIEQSEISRSYLPFPVGVITGSAIIEISTPNTTAELINLTACKIRVTDTANITIFQIDG